MSRSWTFAHTKTGRCEGTGLGNFIPKECGGAKINKALGDLEKRIGLCRPLTDYEKRILRKKSMQAKP